MKRPPPDFATVGWAYGMSEAALAVSVLEAAGVQVLPHTRHMASIAWHQTHALGGIELRVPASQAALASDVLASLQSDKPRRKSVASAILALVILAIVGIPPPASGFFAVRAAPAATSRETG